MAREREHRYLVTLSSSLINLMSIIMFIGFGYFIYYYIFNLSNFDVESEFINILNIYGENILGFILYGLRYILIVLGCFCLYEIGKFFIYGIKKSCLILRIEKGDLYCKCSDFVYKKRAIFINIFYYLFCGCLLFILGIIFDKFSLIIMGALLLIFNVRDFIVGVFLISIGNGICKYIDYDNREMIVIDVRKDFSSYKSILVKEIKMIEEDVVDTNVFRMSKLTLLILILLTIGVILGVIL